MGNLQFTLTGGNMVSFIQHSFKKHYLVTWVSILLVSGFLATSLVSYNVARKQVKIRISKDTLPLTSDSIYSEIQRYILPPSFIASLMAHDTFLRDWVLAGEKDLPALTRYLTQIKEKYGTVTSFLISDITKHYYYAEGILKKVQEGTTRDKWYFRLRNSEDEEFETSTDPDMTNRDVFTIFANHKLRDYEGHLLGVTGVGLTFDTISHIISNIETQFNRNVYFLDSNGEIIVTGSRAIWEKGFIRDLEGISQIADQILTENEAPIELEYRFEGRNIMLNTRYIPALSWYLIVEQDETELSRPIRLAFIINIIISTAITLIIIALVLFFIFRYQQKLHTFAVTDSLTGIMNRKALELIFHQGSFMGDRTTTCMLLIDIDYLKKINDSYGHLIGDEVIQTISKITQETVPASSFLSRWGGDEFLILVSNCHLEKAKQLGEEIRKKVEQHRFSTPSGEFQATVSVGVSEYRLSETLTTNFAQADRALYLAKSEGGNRTVVCECTL